MDEPRPTHRTDLTFVVAITGVAMLLALPDVTVPAVRVVRAVVGGLLALVLPGYALLAAVFPQPTLGRTERVLGSVAMSMALATLGGFALNLTPWGLRAQTWAALLGTITLAAVAVAYRRRGVAGENTAPPPPIRVTPMQGALFGLAAVVLVIAAGVAYIGAVRAPGPGFTQLWLLPAAGDGQMRVGFRDEEGTRATYVLRIQADGALVREWNDVTLAPDETWEMPVTLLTQQADAHHFEALLYRADEVGIVYRRATLER